MTDSSKPEVGPLDAAKRALRSEIRKALASTRPERLAEHSQAIRDSLSIWLASRRPGTVLAFSPLADEPDLRVVWASWQHSGWRIAFPRSTATDAHGFEPVVMSMDDQQWTRGPFGTQEPASRFPAVPIDAIDVILVPARSIDRRGARLGRGGGVYDRVLNRLPQRCQRVGVIFSLQFRESIPSGPQDAQIGLWVDETGWHRPAAPKEIVANTAEA